MSTSIDEIPTIEDAGRLGRRHSADPAVADAYSMPMRPASGLLTSLGIAKALELTTTVQQQLFPSAQQLASLQAAPPSYTMYQDCGPYDYDATCNEACFGFAPHHMDPYYCATCPEQEADPKNNPSYNWHFVGSRGNIRYIDREPDVCAGRDAWKWKIEGQCGNCAQSSVFRCHDGWKKYPDSSSWDPTICQGMVSCDGNLTTC
ncbi:MAG: hypothetical protein M3291_05920 [Actinomycetota bacterium]|nr:hypothetical protein [Actinomycetota bacterium]